jgi:ergothioneine biosynthesis protein EgtB
MPLKAAGTAAHLAEQFTQVRALTCALAEPLSEADAQVQSMPDASPVKWHLAHTTWFFETLLLERFEAGFRAHHPAYRMLFNSYYNAVGAQHARPQRGLITRPGLAEIQAWRRAVDRRVHDWLSSHPPEPALALLTLGLNHEQQHQELILSDLKHLLGCNPLAPAYRARPAHAGKAADVPALGWVSHDGGPVDIGHAGAGFAFDNEAPRHRHWLAPHALADRLVTQGEFAGFIADGGYGDPRWWLSAGWDWVRTQQASAPMYWQREPQGGWSAFTLHGLQPLQADAPAVHLNLYEADAYARWAGAQSGMPLRLPTEAEWEHGVERSGAAARVQTMGLCADTLESLHPQADLARRGSAGHGKGPLHQAFGQVWQWTASAYAAYPGYRPWAGAVGEYNGKFMVNQYVLRGSSFATPRGHARLSYRNFFPADARWQFTGLRLACDLR